MFHRKHWFDWFASIVLLASLGSCDGLGSGCGCSMGALPQGGLPKDQTLEGGAQIRITPSGFNKITGLLDGYIGDALASGFCIPKSTPLLGIDICYQTDGTCAPGCLVTAHKDSFAIAPASSDPLHTLQIDIQLDASTQMPADPPLLPSCTLDITITNGKLRGMLATKIDPASGQLTAQLASLDFVGNPGLEIDGCLGVGEIIEFVIELFPSLLTDQIKGVIEGYIADLLPSPLGLEGVLDVSDLIGFVSKDSNPSIELRVLPGGFADLQNNGFTLGTIVGINSDRNRATRTPALDSEPARCVPPLPTPDYAKAPASLPLSSRGTFTLRAAEEFRGMPELPGDIAVGVSETALDLAGHHVVTSGAMCMGLGSELIPQLNLGIISLLAPSLATLGNGSGQDPLLILTRPLRPIDFTIGDGTMTSPALQIAVRDLEIDFYAFVLERYMRLFTVNLALSAGLNLEPMTMANGTTALVPVLTGLESENIQVSVLNTELLAESKDRLEAVLPSVLDLALPYITDAIPPIELPAIGDFQLSQIAISKVVTSEDDFLTVRATLQPSPALARQAAKRPLLLSSLPESEAAIATTAPERADTRARIREVRTPAPAIIRAGLAGEPGGALPEVIIDIEPFDALGNQLEWSWNLDGGIWRPFTSAAPLVIRDRALVWQGKHEIGVRARVVGDYRTLDLDPVVLPVVIDSAAPTILVKQARISGGTVIVPASDLVTTEDAIEFAYGRPSDDHPATAWQRGAFEFDEVAKLAEGGKVVVYARDELDNTGSASLEMDTLRTVGNGGCACSASGSDAQSMAGVLFLAALTLLFLAVPRRRSMHGQMMRVVANRLRSLLARRAVRTGLGTITILAMANIPGCDCGTRPPDVVEKCQCPEGAGAICVPLRLGRFSEMALSSKGEMWISAYNEQHGDLGVTLVNKDGVVADTTWEYVDGVPEGPVVYEDCDRRNGVLDPGPDVGLYSSIAVNPNDEALVSYFDKDNASLMFAGKFDGVWQSHTVEQGKPGLKAEDGFAIIGEYSSITVRSDTGFPGIAYYARTANPETGEITTEVRFASAQTERPASPEDWVFYVADQVVLPPAGTAVPDPLTIPPGKGLFIDSARLGNQTPVIVYYDRLRGDLVLARFDLVAGGFAAPQILDGADGSDVGWYPSVAVSSDDSIHVTYKSASNDDLLYINTSTSTREVIDDGYRVVGTTPDGLPKPEFHLVGDDSSLVMTDKGPAVAYQDATAYELLLASRDSTGAWQHRTLAGAEETFAGAYGFYASAAYDGLNVAISNWVIHPAEGRVWVEAFHAPPVAP